MRRVVGGEGSVRGARWGAFALAWMVALPASAAPLKLPRFPLKAEGPVRHGPVLADFDGDGALEVAVEAGGKLVLFGPDGKPAPGFPVELGGVVGHTPVQAVGSPAAGDLDGDGHPDLAVAVSLGEAGDGFLVAVSTQGAVLPGFPVALPKGPGAGPTLADVDADGTLDLAIGGRDGKLHVVTAKGAPVAGFPVTLSAGVSSPIAFGSLVKGQRPALACGTSDGRVHVVLTNGQPAAGFPAETRYAISGAPAFGDIDNDGEHEVVVASQDFKIYVLNADGSPLPGFPVQAGYRVYGGAALGDLDRDGQLDIAVASGDKLYAWNSFGKSIAGFPIAVGGKIAGGVVLVDGDRDGADELYAAGEGLLHGYFASGKRVEGFPVKLPSDAADGPAVADIVPDPALELVVAVTGGEVHGYRLQRKGEVTGRALSWPMPGHDALRQSHFGPNAARYRDATLAPTKLRAGESLKVAYRFFDLDGDPEPATLVRWYADGQHVPELDNARELPGAKVKKGQSWVAAVQGPDDFAVFKDGPGAAIAKTAPVVVGNTPPGAPVVEVALAQATTADTLSMRVVTPAADVDGDKITYRLRWLRDGEFVVAGETVDPALTQKGEKWTVVATPFDGTDEGAPAEASIVIRNSVPEAPEVALSPAAPTIENDVAVQVVKPPVDADGDTVLLRYAFTVNGQRRSLPADKPVLPKGAARKGDRVVVEVWGEDGQGEGARGRAEVVIGNAAPGAPKVAIFPANPAAGDDLAATVVEPAADPDRDALAYRVQWSRNGQKGPATPVVAAAEVKKKERWTAEVVASDGQKESPVAKAEVVVGNTAPGRAKVALSSGTPAVDEPLKVTAEAPADPDGDAVKLEYAWFVDGKPVGAKDKVALAAGEFRKGQRLAVEVVALDDEKAAGEPVRVEAIARNSAPGAAVVALEPERPTIETGLRATIRTAATDKDGDKLAYRYRWFRNGAPVPELDGREVLKAGEVKRGEAWRVEVRAHDGEVEGAAAEAVGVVQDAMPPAPAVSFAPERPTTVTGVKCVVPPPTDADGDAVAIEYRWSRDGVAVPAAGAELAAGLVRAGETWKCEARARAKGAAGPFASATVAIGNAVPLAPKVAVQPTAPKVGEALACVVTEEARDPDGDALTYAYRWIAPNGVTVPAGESPWRVAGGLLKRGQAWRCEATASDGKASAAAESAPVTVVNSGPAVARPKVVPAVPAAGAELRCELASPVEDPDGDAVTLSYQWFRNGERQPFAESSTGVPGRLVKPGDRWWCVATAKDAEAVAPAGRSPEVKVAPGAAAAK